MLVANCNGYVPSVTGSVTGWSSHFRADLKK
jgi:hypothetical protein